MWSVWARCYRAVQEWLSDEANLPEYARKTGPSNIASAFTWGDGDDAGEDDDEYD